jgi:lactobin A/cerein 7B family class IIb bacteriocin
MVKLNETELQAINGGISVWTAIGIGALITFLAGVIDGIVRPLSCNK